LCERGGIGYIGKQRAAKDAAPIVVVEAHMHGCGSWLLLVALAGSLIVGCEQAPEFHLREVETATPPEIGTAFDPRSTGVVTGRVTWAGDIPNVPLFHAPMSPAVERIGEPVEDWPNPLAPRIDPKSRGVAETVVFLRGIDPRRGRPWDHPPARVVLTECQIRIAQGGQRGRVGVARLGDTIEMATQQGDFDVLQARGAAFFSLTFPESSPPRSRHLNRAGIVEFNSGAGHFWARAHLFVAEHPYWTRTDAHGDFVLTQVPPGDYDLVFWHPSWLPASHERDAGTLHLDRLTYAPPVEVVQRVNVKTGETARVSQSLSKILFDRK
jgi:hypothetical protein